MFRLDTTTTFGTHVAKRLEYDTIIWLVTVGSDGTPQPSPVWFVWNGESFLIYSEPGKPKLHNIIMNPHVALHLESDGQGGDIVVFTGRAWIDAKGPTDEEERAYRSKYAESLERLGMSYDEMRRSYSVVIRVTPERLRGWN
ncbi:MAG TPA: TIGR03667 family PPOX class F420-dependent oxidoreductase [Actinopolymorphaceae bacterium]|jgi:PPOX class probable F420-dependent enzyme